MPPKSESLKVEPVETKKVTKVSSKVAAALEKCKNLKDKKAQVNISSKLIFLLLQAFEVLYLT